MIDIGLICLPVSGATIWHLLSKEFNGSKWNMPLKGLCHALSVFFTCHCRRKTFAGRKIRRLIGIKK